MPGAGDLRDDSMKLEDDEIDMVNSELSGEMLPLSIREDTCDELKNISVAPSHLASYLKTEQQQMSQRESQKSHRNTMFN